MSISYTKFTEVAENRMKSLKNKFRLPQEVAIERFKNIAKDKGKSNFYGDLYELMKGCGYGEVDFRGKTFNEVNELLKKLKTKAETITMILDELYNIYSKHQRQGEYMERIVRKLGDESFEKESIRVAILKQFVKYLQEDMKSIHDGVSSVIRYIKRDDKKCKTIEDVIKKIDESIFDNISNNHTDKSSEEKGLSNEGKVFLKTIDDLSKCVFRGQGATREAMYTFAFAYGLTYYEDSQEIDYNKYRDIDKVFVDTFNDNLFRYIGEHRNRENNAIPTGEMVNFKNFAEVICIYYLSKKDEEISRYQRYVGAMDCIEKCKQNSIGIKSEGRTTEIFRLNYFENVAKINNDDDLVDYIIHNYYVPEKIKHSGFKTVAIDTKLIETVTGEAVNETARVAIVNKFIENKFVGDGSVTGVTTFLKKAKGLGISDITDESLNEYWESKMINPKKDRKLIGIANHLIEGLFDNESIARESLFKFAFVFDMKLYEDETETGYDKNRDIEKLLLIPFLGEGINYEKKLDTVCAYYLRKDGIEPEGKTKTVIGEKMKRVKAALEMKGNGEGKIVSGDKKNYFWNCAVNMEEEAFQKYVAENFEDEKESNNFNDFYTESNQITAFNIYKSIVSEIQKMTSEDEMDITLEMQDDVEIIIDEFNKTKYSKDDNFMKLLLALIKMVTPDKNVNYKNMTRSKLISLEYYKMKRDLDNTANFEQTYDEILDYINMDLIDARYNPLDTRSMYDLFVVFLVYIQVVLMNAPKN
ncbi:MAG: hypothetical protein IJ435_01365 [Clostridia bacterium]|nr:hypothetical protein [Clostridia bacterium]